MLIIRTGVIRSILPRAQSFVHWRFFNFILIFFKKGFTRYLLHILPGTGSINLSSMGMGGGMADSNNIRGFEYVDALDVLQYFGS